METLPVKFAGSMLASIFFIHLTTRLGRDVIKYKANKGVVVVVVVVVGRLFLLLLIIFSAKSKSDTPSQENQQLKQAKQNTFEPAR